MKVLAEWPPNIEEIKKVFAINSTTVFTYGDTIYNPNSCPLDTPILTHEELHSRQQGEDPKAWWDKYLSDIEFRLEQELAAYQVQYWVQCKFIPDRNTRALNLQRLAETLAGSMYNNLISVKRAKELIKWKPKKTKKKST